MKRLLIGAAIVAVVGFGTIAPGIASAAPVWNLELHHAPTVMHAGEEGELWFAFSNLGDENSHGTSTLTVQLPVGLARARVLENGWTCPGSSGDNRIVCTTTEPQARKYVHSGATFGDPLVIFLDVSPELVGKTVTVSASLEGGGAAGSSIDVEPIEVGTANAPFGFVPGSWKAGFFEEDGATPDQAAASHPSLATFSFDLNNEPITNGRIPNEKAPVEAIHRLEVQLPPGVVANPSAVGECAPLQLLARACPPNSQVGRLDAGTEPLTPVDQFGNIDEAKNVGRKEVSVYNMVHPKGTAADLAVDIEDNLIHIDASLNPANGYGIRTVVPSINQFLPLFYQKLTLWGVPSSPSHDVERCGNDIHPFTAFSCPIPDGKPFLTLPSSCGTQGSATLSNYDSWQNLGLFGPPIEAPIPGELSGCDHLAFEPSLSVAATSDQAATPSGLRIDLKVPQNEDVNGAATPPVKSVNLTLPEGVSLSPSFATGLAGCSEAEIGISAAGVPNAAEPNCPESSRIGDVTVQSNLLAKPLDGSLYLANQGENPFGTTFAVYLALHDSEERGITVKIPGRLRLDGGSGRVTASFDDLPQLPFEELSVSLRGGPRAPLVNAARCGSQSVTASLASYAQPGAPVDIGSAYQVNIGANGTPCPPAIGFHPQLSAGTDAAVAGRYSPFTFRLSREDQESEILSISTTLPPGLLANISNVSSCSEATLASISTAEGTGRAQQATPSCPSASRLGSVLTGAGAGPEPKYFPGAVYLAGPYKGAPLSLAIVVPAVAGPYDLGNVVVRAAIFVDQTNAQVRVVSDPLPTIVDGVPLRLRDIRVDIDRPSTTLNPTNCNPLAVHADIGSTAGTAAALQSRFQVGNCAALPFKPKLALAFKGGTRRSKNPALTATLTQPAGQANISTVSVVLPKTEFIDNRHINNPCTRVQFNEHACPPKSILGYARAYTPLLSEPLEGPVYFRSNGGERTLPDLVAALHGRFDINVVGFIDSVKHKGSEISQVRTTFETVPDAPVSKFVLSLKGGKEGLLQNSANLCKRKVNATVEMNAQNGRAANTVSRIKTDCGRRSGSKRQKKRLVGQIAASGRITFRPSIW